MLKTVPSAGPGIWTEGRVKRSLSFTVSWTMEGSVLRAHLTTFVWRLLCFLQSCCWFSVSWEVSFHPVRLLSAFGGLRQCTQQRPLEPRRDGSRLPCPAPVLAFSGCAWASSESMGSRGDFLSSLALRAPGSGSVLHFGEVSYAVGRTSLSGLCPAPSL